ncbi:ABC transporter substrate-binding protein [Methanoculleus taiwanensis]|uniref:ABC transporter substrate-binding protein n=1 Tax=Methanoculleus taiwanensis TaxID=1550565 RepID=A0A498H2B8_9EURY|nr:basic amino acid ABC transporter substrate-binding protein [Methanoculleus taiwanensis]RXE56086.1 ABC transporter substrate-binding protein [Methanoculleus taiwanensis]
MERKVLGALCACILMLVVGIAGCTGTETPTTTDTGAKQTYIIGIDAEYPPYSYLDKDGNAIGFDVDSAKWIAEQQGFEVKFQPTAWDGIIPALQAGKIDMVYSGMTITDERKEKVNFSIPYWQVNQTVAIHNDTAVTMDNFYAGTLIVGAQRGTTGQIWVEENLIDSGKMPSENLKLYDSFPLVAADLQNKRIDAAIYDKPPMLDAIADKPAHIIGEIDTGEVYGIAIRKTDTELLETMNEGLTKLMADPYWEELKTTWDM